MKRIITILFSILILYSCSQKNKSNLSTEFVIRNHLTATTITEEVGDSLVIQVELIDELDSTKFPPCGGMFTISYPIKYKVIKVIHGDYNGVTISINHSCLREKIQNKIIEYHKAYTYKLTWQVEKNIIIGKEKTDTLDIVIYSIIK